MNDKLIVRLITTVSIVVFLVVVILQSHIITIFPQGSIVPSWVFFLPKLNAIINGTCSVLLLVSLYQIKGGNIRTHKLLNITTFILSSLFLVSYIIFHATLSVPYPRDPRPPCESTHSSRSYTDAYGIRNAGDRAKAEALREATRRAEISSQTANPHEAAPSRTHRPKATYFDSCIPSRLLSRLLAEAIRGHRTADQCARRRRCSPSVAFNARESGSHCSNLDRESHLPSS